MRRFDYGKLIYAIPIAYAAFCWGGLFVLPLRAQQQPAAPDYTITLNGQEWFQIGEALADRPFKVANPILAKINAQVTAIAAQRQREAEEKAKADAEPKKPE